MENKNELSIPEFNKILLLNGFKELLSDEEKRALYRFFYNNGYTADRLKLIFSGAKKYAIATRKNSKYIGPRELKQMIVDILKTQDTRTYEQFGEIDAQLKKYYKENNLEFPKSFDKIIKALFEKVNEINRKNNSEIESFSDDSYAFIYNFACLYSSLAKYVQTSTNKLKSNAKDEEELLSELDKLIIKRFLRLKCLENLSLKDVQEFSEFLDELTGGKTADQNELFSSSDVYALLNKTASIIGNVTREKLIQTRSVFKDYINYVAELSIEDEKIDFSAIENFTTKDLFLNSGALLIRSPDNVQSGIRFLMGAPVSEILNTQPKEYLEKLDGFNNLVVNFPSLHLTGMTSAKHMYILEKRTSLFSTLHLDNINKVATSIVNNIYSALSLGSESAPVSEKIAKLKSLGFNVDEIITADNIVEIFDSNALTDLIHKNSYIYNTMQKNVQILSSVLSLKDIQKIFSSNYNFMSMDSDKLIEKLKRVIARSDESSLAKNIEELVNIRAPYNLQRSSKKITRSNNNKVDDDNGNVDIPPIDKDKITISGISIDTEKLNNAGLSIPLDIITALGKSGFKYVDTIDMSKNDRDKKTTNMTDALETIEITNPSIKIKSAQDYAMQIYANLNRIAYALKMYENATSSADESRAGLIVRANINALKMNIAEFNKFDDVELSVMYNLITSITSYQDLVANSLKLASERKKSNSENLVELYSKQKERKGKSTEYIEKTYAMIEETKKALKELGLSDSFIKSRVENLNDDVQFALMEKDEKQREDARAEKELLDETSRSYEGASVIERSLSNMSGITKSIIDSNIENLKDRLYELKEKHDKLEKLLNYEQEILKNKQDSMHSHYTREHIQDEDYTTAFMTRLNSAMDKQKEKIKKLKAELKSLDEQINEIEEIISSRESGFGV